MPSQVFKVNDESIDCDRKYFLIDYKYFAGYILYLLNLAIT